MGFPMTRVPARRALSMKRWTGDPTALLYALPALLPLLAFWIAPMLFVLLLSFAQWDFLSPIAPVGVANYEALATDPDFLQSLSVTLYFAAGSVVPTMVGGLLLALLLNARLRGAAIYRAILFSPWVTPTVAVSLVWSWIFDPGRGLANALLGVFHIAPLAWTNSPTLAMPAILIVTVWQGMGWSMVFYLVALKNVPSALLEAAALDGANRWKSFWHVTLPKISPTSFFLGIVLVINSLQAFDQIKIMTQGGPAGATRTLLYLYYQDAFEQFNIGQASAVAIFIVVITAVISVAGFIYERRVVSYD